MENILRIQENLIAGVYSGNPQGAAEDQAILSGEYSWLMGQLEEILRIKSVVWMELRKNVKSDTAADRAYDATPDGIKETTLRLQAKSIEKMMSALKSIIQIASDQSRNQY